MVLNAIQMEQTTDKKNSFRQRGEDRTSILARLRSRALRRLSLLLNEEHWAWTPPGPLAQHFGAANRATSAYLPSPWSWWA